MIRLLGAALVAAASAWLGLSAAAELGRRVRRLEALSAAEFTDGGPAGQQEISLVVHLDNESFPQVEVKLYRQDGTTCLAEVDGKSVCLVDRSDVVDLMEAVRAIVLN